MDFFTVFTILNAECNVNPPLNTIIQVPSSGCFQKQGYPQIMNFNRIFHYIPSILGYPYFWKHPSLPGFPKWLAWHVASKVRPDLNGSLGTVVEWDDKEQRWKVSRNAPGEWWQRDGKPFKRSLKIEGIWISSQKSPKNSDTSNMTIVVFKNSSLELVFNHCHWLKKLYFGLQQ